MVRRLIIPIHIVTKLRQKDLMTLHAAKHIIANLRVLRGVLVRSTEDTDACVALTRAIAERLREILPDGEFSLESDDRAIHIVGIGPCRGNSYNTMPWLLWSGSESALVRLERIFETYSRDIQRFLTNSRKRPWPVEGAAPHIDIGPETIDVWWGGFKKMEAAVRLRPFDRKELGI
jgi:hypothetical protein